MQLHLKLLEVEPFRGLSLVEVVVILLGSIAKRVELPSLVEQQGGRLLGSVASSRSHGALVHEVNVGGIFHERIRVAAVRCSKIDGSYGGVARTSSVPIRCKRSRSFVERLRGNSVISDQLLTGGIAVFSFTALARLGMSFVDLVAWVAGDWASHDVIAGRN